MRHDQGLCAYKRVTECLFTDGWRLMKSALRSFVILLLWGLFSSPVFSQDKATALSATAHWASTIAEQYQIQPDITYGVANNYTLKLDEWQRKDANKACPTLMYYHV